MSDLPVRKPHGLLKISCVPCSLNSSRCVEHNPVFPKHLLRGRPNGGHGKKYLLYQSTDIASGFHMLFSIQYCNTKSAQKQWAVSPKCQESGLTVLNPASRKI